MNKSETFKLIQVGVYAALIIIAITFIRIPMPSAISNSFVHPGNALVTLSVLLMGLKRGVSASAIGIFLFDAFNGYLVEAPFTVLENVVVVLGVALFYQGLFGKKDTLTALVTVGVVGALIKIGVVFIGFVLRQLLLGAVPAAAFVTAMTGMPASIFTGVVTAVLVPVLYYPMKSIFSKFHNIGE